MSVIDEITLTDPSNGRSSQEDLPSTNQSAPRDQLANEKSVHFITVDFPKPSTGGSTLSSHSGKSSGSNGSKKSKPESFLDYLTSNQPQLDSGQTSVRTQTDPMSNMPEKSSGSAIDTKELKKHITSECKKTEQKILEKIPGMEDTLKKLMERNMKLETDLGQGFNLRFDWSRLYLESNILSV